MYVLLRDVFNTKKFNVVRLSCNGVDIIMLCLCNNII